MRALSASALLCCACAASTPAGEATLEEVVLPVQPPPAPISEAERLKLLDAACGDHARFEQVALETARDRAQRDALEVYRSLRATRSGEPVPKISQAQRREMERVVRLYLERCGLAETIALAGKLIEFPTVSAREPAGGESFVALARFLEEWSEASGLSLSVSGENDVWEIAYGRGDPTVAFLLHADVVPLDDGLNFAEERSSTIDAVTGEPLPPGWTRAPFRGTVEGGRLYGRGSENNKGPLAAALVVMRTLALLNLEPAGRILAIIGNGEEHDWAGMKRYVDAMKVLPKHVISVDANFPVVVAESGFVAWNLSAPMEARGDHRRCALAVDAFAGELLTQVPGEASVTFESAGHESPDRLLSRVQAAAAQVARDNQGKLRVEIEIDETRVKAAVYGEAVYSSAAEDGRNALWGLAALADAIGLCDNGLRAMLEMIHVFFAGDHFGVKLGLAYEHPLMGRLLVSPTMLRVTERDAIVVVNMRRPAGVAKEEFAARMDTALAVLRKKIDARIREGGERYVGEPALSKPDGRLASTLLEIYRRETGEQDAQPISIRGGTYARLFDGAVSFGPGRPGQAATGHGPDEYVELDSLALLTRGLYEATLVLDASTSASGNPDSRASRSSQEP